MNIDRARTIVADYGELITRETNIDISDLSALVASTRFQVSPQSLLPHPKWMIKQALQLCFVSGTTRGYTRESIAQCFTDLAQYIPDSEAKKAYVEAENGTIPAVLTKIDDTRKRLILEFYSFIFDLRDEIPEAPKLILQYAKILGIT